MDDEDRMAEAPQDSGDIFRKRRIEDEEDFTWFRLNKLFRRENFPGAQIGHGYKARSVSAEPGDEAPRRFDRHRRNRTCRKRLFIIEGFGSAIQEREHSQGGEEGRALPIFYSVGQTKGEEFGSFKFF